MDPSVLLNFLTWARKNVRLAIFVAVFSFFMYAGYSFVGGYAARFGESFLGNYANFKANIASYTVIDMMLRNYLVTYKASRVSIGRFHNTIRDIVNNEMFFVTFENTIAVPGVTLDVAPRDVSATVFSTVLPALVDGKPSVVIVKDLPDMTLRQTMVNNGTKVAAFIPIHDLKDHLMGMIMVGWLNESDVPTDEQLASMMKSLAQAADRIGAYLNAR